MISASPTRSGSIAAMSPPIPIMAMSRSGTFPACRLCSVSEGAALAMKYASYWRQTATAFSGGAEGPVEGHVDVAVIGGGFTGLGAALQLAKAGAKVVVLEAEQVCSGASGRNGGHLNNGL